MPYKRKTINPVSGQRLREEIKTTGYHPIDPLTGKPKEEKEYTLAGFAALVGMDPKVIGFLCQGNRRITEERAAQFAKIFNVRPEYLLGIDDFRTQNLDWLDHATDAGVKKERFLEACLEFWDYSIVGNDPITEAADQSLEIVGMSYKIKKPSGDIVSLSTEQIGRLQDDLCRATRRIIREALEPEY